jgi:hypothetical protein
MRNHTRDIHAPILALTLITAEGSNLNLPRAPAVGGWIGRSGARGRIDLLAAAEEETGVAGERNEEEGRNRVVACRKREERLVG